MIKSVCLPCLFSLLLTGAAFGQYSAPVSGQPPRPVFDPPVEVPGIVSFFAPCILPKILQDDSQLKEYIRSEEFAQFRHTYGDLYAIDAIFDKAMRCCWNNVFEALLVSFFGTMDHDKFGVRLPVVGDLLWVPLTAESSDEFSARLRALPRLLYPDTPHEGDRDKLQHFFGSALIAYVCESDDASDRVGLDIEWGEEKFIVGGVNDERDVRANRQGQRFGLHLLDDAFAHPSGFFSISPPDSSGVASPVHDTSMITNSSATEVR